MANIILFLDHSHANIFELKEDTTEEHTLTRKEIKNHRSADKENNKHKDESKFFGELAVELRDAGQILLVGPGLAKTEFKHFVDEMKDQHLSAKVVGLETVDHPTDGQLVAMGRKYFKMQ